MTEPAETVVDGYLAALGARLVGPRRYRHRVLAEIRDGLWEATNAHHADPEPEAAAMRAAVAEFGDPSRVAAGFAEAGAAAQARKTAFAFVATGPLVGIWWLLALTPPGPWPALPLVAIGTLTAVAVLAATGRLSRFLPVRGRHTLGATMITAVACVAGDLTVLGVLVIRAATAPATLPLALAAIAITGSLARLAYAQLALGTCVRTRRALAS